MKLSLYEIGQYTDTKFFYITRLQEVNCNGTVLRAVVKDDILTRAEAKAHLARFNAHGLRPLDSMPNEGAA
jgi:hypothetical protein